MRGDGGVAGEGRVVGVPKFHSWSTFIMPLTNINSDWMSFSEFHSDRAYRSFRKGCNRNVALK